MPLKINFNRLGEDFFRCYFGEKQNVSATDVSKLLGGRYPRKWVEKFLILIEAANMPYAVKRGRLRVTPGTLAAWFEFESSRRG